MSEKETTGDNPQKPGKRTIKFVSDDDGQEFEFEWPLNHHMSRFTREASSNPMKAHTNMVMSLAIKPTVDELKTLFEKKPGRPIALGNEIGKQSGLIEEYSAKN